MENKIKNYSYSALSTYKQCSLKYDLSYVKFIKTPKVYSYDLVKGLIFHDYAEHYRSTEEFSDHRSLLDYSFHHADDVSEEFLARLTIEEKQNIVNACSEFRTWWDTKFSPDAKVCRETKLLGTDPFNFTGVLDLYYEDKDGLHIVDYKTPKNANISFYRDQLELYAHFLSLSLKKPVKSISIYFAFAQDIKDSRLYKVPMTKVEGTVEKYKNLVTEITGPDRKAEANLSRMCDYCQFRGLDKYCPVSVVAGAKPQLPV